MIQSRPPPPTCSGTENHRRREVRGIRHWSHRSSLTSIPRQGRIVGEENECEGSAGSRGTEEWVWVVSFADVGAASEWGPAVASSAIHHRTPRDQGGRWPPEVHPLLRRAFNFDCLFAFFFDSLRVEQLNLGCHRCPPGSWNPLTIYAAQFASAPLPFLTKTNCSRRIVLI